MSTNDGDFDDDPTVWWFAGDEIGELMAALDRREPSSGPGRTRLGIVDPDDRKLRLARRMLTEGQAWRGRSDIWFTQNGLLGDANGVGRIAFLFPGVEPAFGAEAIDVPALARRLGLAAPALGDGNVAQRSASIIRLGIFLDEALRRIGIEPDVIAGHSIGEWAGSVAAGTFTRADAYEIIEGVDLGGIDLPDLDFAALSAGVTQVEPIVADIPAVVVSHDNSPGQSVICGPPAQVALAMAALRDANILGYTLDFQSGFHTPFVEPALVAFRHHLEHMTVTAPRRPLWSATLAAPYPTDPAEIVALHLRHLVERVSFGPMIRRLYDDTGARVFVQLGIGTLTGFVDDTLGDRDHACVQVVTPKRSAVAQMYRALTALWVEGLEVDLSVLEQAPVEVPAEEPLPPIEVPTTRHAELVGVGAVASGSPATALLGAAEMMTAAASAGQDIIGALLARLSPESVEPPLVPAPPIPAPTPAPAPPPQPTSGGRRAWPTETVKMRRALSLESMPETLDHRLFHQPPGWEDLTDGFPIVAMTTQIQLLQDIATEFGGGRHVVEVFGVRNLRWLDLSEPQEVPVTVVPKGDDVLSIALGNYCRANLRLADTYPPAPAHVERPLVDPRPTMLTAQEMFARHIMFHGPRFQGIPHMGPIGQDGMVADFDNLDTPGSLLDNLGKMIAWWVIDHHDALGRSPLPIGVERITFYGPLPDAGVPVHCDVRIVADEDELVTADGVLVLPDERLWCRVDRWSSHVFHLDLMMEPVYHETTTRFATEPHPTGGWNVVLERWPTGAGRDFTAQRFMCRAERDMYRSMNLLEQRRWLIEVVAVKDSVRRWLMETYGIGSFPVEVQVLPDGENRYRVACRHVPEQHDLRVTVSSVRWLATAIIGDGAYRDIEAVEVPNGGDRADTARAAAEAVAARNPGARVESVQQVDHVVPSNLPTVHIPSFAVAWTA